MPIGTPSEPFHVTCKLCFEAEQEGPKDHTAQCTCGLERLRDEHAAMRALLINIHDNSLDPVYWASAVHALLAEVEK